MPAARPAAAGGALKGTRLGVAAAMAALLLFCLSYWWLGNLAHEMFGAAVFALLARHLTVSRRWFTGLGRGRYDLRRRIAVGLNLALLANMAVLLVTSVAISRSLFAFLHLRAGVTFKQVHWFSAYWVMVIVGIHLGLQWGRVMGMVRAMRGGTAADAAATALLRAGALCLAGFGIWSFAVLDVWTKLLFRLSLDFWDFNASVAPFFGYWAGVVGLPAVVTHYGIALLRRRARVVPVS